MGNGCAEAATLGSGKGGEESVANSEALAVVGGSTMLFSYDGKGAPVRVETGRGPTPSRGRGDRDRCRYFGRAAGRTSAPSCPRGVRRVRAGLVPRGARPARFPRRGGGVRVGVTAPEDRSGPTGRSRTVSKEGYAERGQKRAYLRTPRAAGGCLQETSHRGVVIALVEDEKAEMARMCERCGVERPDVFGSATGGGLDPERCDIVSRRLSNTGSRWASYDATSRSRKRRYSGLWWTW